MAARRKTGGKRLLVGCLILFVLTALDQLTKEWSARALPGHPRILIPGVLQLAYVENRGAAFGILTDARWFFIFVSVIILLLTAVCFIRYPAGSRETLILYCLPVLAAGALGNLLDRLMLRYVRDFIYVELIHFPVFNVADMCVTLSAAVLVLNALLSGEDTDLTWLKGR